VRLWRARLRARLACYLLGHDVQPYSLSVNPDGCERHGVVFVEVCTRHCGLVVTR
jgi:hypothetical protein